MTPRGLSTLLVLVLWLASAQLGLAGETTYDLGGNPTYHRVEEFEKWIEDQAKMEQTFILDYTLALDLLEFNLRGLWDPAEWNDRDDDPGSDCGGHGADGDEPGARI